MRTISEQELKSILDKHGKWLRSEEGGERADLRYADLRSADLRSADLCSADLRSADLRSADLRYADLRYADLVVFQFRRSWAYFTLDGTLRIGCMVMPITEWVLGYEEIGKKEGYSEVEIMMYGSFIKSCMELFEKENPK